MTLSGFLLVHFPSILSLLGVIILLFEFNARPLYIKLLGVLLLAYSLSHVANLLLFFVFKVNPNYSAIIHILVEFVIITLIYYQAMEKTNKNFFTVMIVMFTIFWACNFLFIQKTNVNSYSLIIECICIILLAIYYCYWLLQKLPTTRLHRLPMFWINAAWIIFFSGNLFLFIFTEYLINAEQNFFKLWTIHNILIIIANSMMVFAVWLDYQNIRLKVSQQFFR